MKEFLVIVKVVAEDEASVLAQLEASKFPVMGALIVSIADMPSVPQGSGGSDAAQPASEQQLWTNRDTWSRSTEGDRV